MSVFLSVFIISFTASLCVTESTNFPEIKSHLKILGTKMVAEAISMLMIHSHTVDLRTIFVRVGFVHHLCAVLYGFV
jgi:hypothetical protein